MGSPVGVVRSIFQLLLPQTGGPEEGIRPMSVPVQEPMATTPCRPCSVELSILAEVALMQHRPLRQVMVSPALTSQLSLGQAV